LQQMLAIMAATILVPIIVSGNGIDLSPAAALAGAGIGTIVYLLFTKRKSPVFLGSSFAFLGAMCAAATAGYGYWGLIIGAVFAGLVYVILSIIVKITGSGWVNKLMQPVIIGPTVALIGLSLSGTAGDWAMHNGASGDNAYNLISILCAVVTFIIIVVASSKGNKTMKLIPFVIGICGGYVLALIFSIIGLVANVAYLQVLDLSIFEKAFSGAFNFSMILDLPKFTIVEAFKQGWNLDGAAIGSLALMFAPIAFVVFAEHIADHKNLSSIIGIDLISNPGLHRTLLGDGIGSIAGALVGGCPNTTYGESIACVAITGNASTWTILGSAVACIILSFFTPFVVLVNSIPKCVMGGACIALYGFIAVSGLKMLKNIDLGENKNLFVVSAILITGIGGISLNFGQVTITPIAV
ncbi:MAG: solute carrier family 23 protein, partial [Clostridia bacterium]